MSQLVKRGTARRLGIVLNPYAHYPQRWVMRVSDEEKS